MGSFIVDFSRTAQGGGNAVLAPIGSAAVVTNTSIMRTARDAKADGGYIFEEEVPAQFGSFRRTLQTHDGRTFSWLRLEAKLAGENAGIAKGDCLICTEDPYSSYWTGTARFKGSNRKGRTRLDAAPIADLDTASAWIENESADYWDTGNGITAGLMHDAFGRMHRDVAQNVGKTARYVLGVCLQDQRRPNLSPVDAAVMALWDSKTVRDLLSKTERGTIKFTYNGEAPVLKQRVRDERVAIMFLSLQQALAGPSDESEKYVGRPVVQLVEQIYRDHLNNLNRLNIPDDSSENIPLDILELEPWGRRQAQQFLNLDRSEAGADA